MKERLTIQDITPEVHSLVQSYLTTRAIAETLREEVDKVKVGVLSGFSFKNDLSIEHGEEERDITDPEDLYLSQDEEGIIRYHAEVDKKLKESGIKPKSMESDFCPALVAEHDQRKIEWALLDEVAEVLECEYDGKKLNNRLLCLGPEKRQQFIDLIVLATLASQ